MTWLQQSRGLYGLFSLIMFSLILSLTLSHSALAQQASTDESSMAVVEGIVTDDAGVPLPGANVRVADTQRGASTEANGRYRLASLPPGEVTLVASFIGYESERQTVRLRAGAVRTLNFQLGESAVALRDVVVTALGIDRERRSLGYAVEDVSGADLAQAGEVNVMNSLAGRVAGLNVIGGSAGLASTPTVIIRGESSLAGDNRPLYVIDGVPVDNTPNTQFAASQSTQVDFGNGLSQVNPQNIKEVSVLKGPSAAALYGSRASNGVILIETKDGSDEDGIGATVTTSLRASNVLRFPDYQNEYSYGNGGAFQYVDGTEAPGWNWGVPLDEGIERTQFRGPRDDRGNLIPTPVTSAPNNVRNFFNTGLSLTTDVAVRGGSDSGSFRASISRSDRTGIMPNTELNQTSVAFGANYDATDVLRVDANANYSKSTSDNLPTSGYGSESTMYFFTWGPRHVDFEERFRDYWVEGEEGTRQAHNDLNWTNNPYFQVYENTNGLDRDRLFGNVAAHLELTDNLNVRARTGLDYSDEVTEQRKAFSTITAPNGWLQETERSFLEWNSNLLVNYAFPLGEHVTIEPSGGLNYMRQTRRNLQLTASALSVPGVYNIGNARSAVQTRDVDQAEEILGVFGASTINYRDVIFLDLTARNDWSSTLPLDNNSYFYPSVSLSVIASDLLPVPSGLPLSFAKLRLSWAQVGNDTEPFRLRNTFSFQPAWGSTQAVTSEGDLANPGLQPEITTSYEAGTNLQFFGSRIQLDATYYRNTTRDQILRVSLARSTGYSSRLVNAGEVRNQGVETSLQLTPVQDLSGFGWDVYLNWTRNRSTVVELAEGIDAFVIGSGPGGGSVQAREGGRMGDMYGRVFQRVDNPSSPYDGKIIYEDGFPQLTDEVRKIGNYNHDWQGGLGTTLRYRNIRLSALLDIREGGRIYSYTHATGIEGGSLEGTTCCRNETVVGDGVVQTEDGSFAPNVQPVPFVTWLRTYYDRPNIESNSFDASYMKLREVTLQYNVSPGWLTDVGVQNLGVSLVGRNLFLWTDVPHIDPETTVKNGAQRVPGFELQQIPSRRSFGLDIQLAF